MHHSEPNQRATSPAVGVVLLLAVGIALAAFSAAFFLGLAEETNPQPNVVLDGTETDNATYRLLHEGGETLDGDRLELQGAADPGAAAGRQIRNGDAVQFYPVEEEITVVWHSDGDESYTLGTIPVDQPLPAPDVGCEWVEDETNGGTDQIKITDRVVNCDVETEDIVKVQSDGVVVGTVASELKTLDLDDGEVYADVTAEDVVNAQDGQIGGSATSKTSDVKIDNSDVDGSVTAEKLAEVQNGGTVDGDVQSLTKDAKVLSGSTVTGSVTAGERVKVDNSTVKGHVYADPDEFDCTDSRINGESCGSYTPREPDDW